MFPRQLAASNAMIVADRIIYMVSANQIWITSSALSFEGACVGFWNMSTTATVTVAFNDSKASYSFDIPKGQTHIFKYSASKWAKV